MVSIDEEDGERRGTNDRTLGIILGFERTPHFVIRLLHLAINHDTLVIQEQRGRDEATIPKAVLNYGDV